MEDIKEFVKLLFSTWWSKILMTLLMLLFIAVFFRITFVNFVDNYQTAYKFDARSGSTETLTGHGYYFTWPIIVKIHTVDLRPMQVCINANQRVLNCKLVQFDSEGIQVFLSWHGRDDYEGPGNNAAGTTNFSEILKSYAYDGSGLDYPFLKVLRELKPEETVR